MAVAPALLIASTVVSAVGAVAAGMQQASAMRQQASIAERNAQIARQNAAENARRQARATELALGQARAGYGAAGVQVEGSPLDILEQAAAQGELDRLTILYQGEVAGQNYDVQASGYRSQAAAAQTSGYVGAGTSLLSGLSKGNERFGWGNSLLSGSQG